MQYLANMGLAQLASAFVITTVLSACGGGSSDPDPAPGGGDPDPVITDGNHRVSKIEYDYDLNGLIDARSIITYSDNAKTVTSNYEYLGDGTPDIYIHGADGIMARNEITFSDSGQQLTFSIENTKEDGSMTSITFSYSYRDDGQLQQIVIDTFGNSSVLDVLYSDGRISSLTDPNAVQPSLVYNYNANGTLASREIVNGGTITQRTDFIWRADGQLESATSQNLYLDPVKNEYLTVVYDDGGKVDKFMQSNEQYPTTAALNLTAIYTWDGDRIVEIGYDPLSQGGIDSIETMTWEEGGCYNQYLPNLGLSLPNFISAQSTVFTPGIFILNPVCAL